MTESKDASLALLLWMRYASAIEQKLPEVVIDQRLKEATEQTDRCVLDPQVQREFVLGGKL